MFFPIRTDSPLRNTPYMNWALIVANILFFAVQNTNATFAATALLYPHDPSILGFFGHMFLHGDLLHLISNMVFLYIFGNNINDKMGHIGYLAFYLAGGIIAATGFVVTEPQSAIPMVGASGAVAAVTGAYLVLLPYSTVTVFYMLFFIGTLELPGFVFVLLFFIKDLIGFSGSAGGIAYAAHLFGTLFGFITCLALIAAHLLPRDQFDVLALIQRWNKRRQYRDMVSKGYNPFEYSPATRSATPHVQPLDPQVRRVMELRSEVSDLISRHDLPAAAARYLDLRRLDAGQVLARQAQLDVANQLAGQQLFKEAAEAYELFLKHYPKFEQIEQVELMLGLIYGRYLNQFEPAKQHLLKAMARLHGERELDMARTELSRIEPLLENQTGGAGGKLAPQ